MQFSPPFSAIVHELVEQDKSMLEGDAGILVDEPFTDGLRWQRPEIVRVALQTRLSLSLQGKYAVAVARAVDLDVCQALIAATEARRRTRYDASKISCA